jgi:hypothetical protein
VCPVRWSLNALIYCSKICLLNYPYFILVLSPFFGSKIAVSGLSCTVVIDCTHLL